MRNILKVFKCVIEDNSKMEQIKDMCHIIRIIAYRIFVFLKEIILLEFTPVLSESDGFEGTDGHFSFSRQAIADFVAFSLVCGLFIIFFYLSQKFLKDEDDCYLNDNQINPQFVDLTVSEENTLNSIYDSPSLNHPWGDGTVGPEKLIPNRSRSTSKKLKPYCMTTDVDDSLSVCTESNQSENCSTTQPNSMTQLKRSITNGQWLVRRTRSGQVYGKYPPLPSYN